MNTLSPATVIPGQEFRGAICSGSLVAPNKVLTAAHCVTDLSSFSFKVGLYENNATTKYYEVEAVAINPSYDANLVNDGIIPFSEIGDDIAILTLSENVIVSQYARIGNVQLGDLYFTIGYGQSDPASVVGKKGANATVNSFGLNDLINFGNDSAYICPGDSGGPLVLRNSNVIVGVTSARQVLFGDQCGINFNQLAANTGANSTFIEEQIGSADESACPYLAGDLDIKVQTGTRWSDPDDLILQCGNQYTFGAFNNSTGELVGTSGEFDEGYVPDFFLGINSSQPFGGNTFTRTISNELDIVVRIRNQNATGYYEEPECLTQQVVSCQEINTTITLPSPTPTLFQPSPTATLEPIGVTATPTLVQTEAPTPTEIGITPSPSTLITPTNEPIETPILTPTNQPSSTSIPTLVPTLTFTPTPTIVPTGLAVIGVDPTNDVAFTPSPVFQGRDSNTSNEKIPDTFDNDISVMIKVISGFAMIILGGVFVYYFSKKNKLKY